MIEVFPASGVVEDAASVVVDELVGDSDRAGDGSSFVDFVHHVLLTAHISVLINRVDFSALLGPATFRWHTVFAFDHGVTSDTVGVAVGLVR
jgi:hypothetical protein